MDLSLRMATFPRHGHLVTAFFPNVWELFKQKKLYHLQEEQILVYKGKKYSGEEALVDVDKLEDESRFVNNIIDALGYIQPDFLFFKENSFVQSHNTLKTAGVPDLVVEVWSDTNEDIERDFKFRIYSSSEKCEHWYLEQDSNMVQCYLGDKELEVQNLNNVLETTKGIKFDLRHLALETK